MQGIAVQVLRVRRRGGRGRGRRVHRRLHHPAGRHRARRRRQPLAAGRPRPDRGRLRAGRRLADPGGPALGRQRRRRTGAGSPPSRPAPTSCRASPRCRPSSTSTLLERAHEDGAVYGSKAVGEPPLMLAFAVREALREAARRVRPAGTSVDLASPPPPRPSTGRSPRRARTDEGHRRGQAGPHRSGRPGRPSAARVGGRAHRRPPPDRGLGVTMDWLAARRAAARPPGGRRCWSRWPRPRARTARGRRQDGGLGRPAPGARSVAATSRRCAVERARELMADPSAVAPEPFTVAACRTRRRSSTASSAAAAR